MFAQSPQIDSLKALLNAHPQADTIRVNQLNELSKAVKNSDPSLQLRLAQEALALAKQLGFGAGQAQAYLHLSAHSMTANDYKQAVVYAQQAQQLYTRLGNLTGQINCLTRLSYIDTDQGNYAQSIAYAQKALTLVEPIRDKSLKAYINYLLAQNYTMLDDYAKARSYALVGLHFAQATTDLNERVRGLSILAIISNKQGQLATARHYFEQTLPLSEKLGKLLDRATNEGNIAEVSEQAGQYADAFRYGRRVLAYIRRINATSYLPWIENILARTHLHTGRADSAIYYASRGLQGGDAGGLRDVSRDATKVLAEAYAKQGNYADAYRYLTRYMILKDSLKGEETIRRTTAMQYAFDLDKKQSQIALLTKNQKIEQEQSRYQRGLLYASGIGVLLLIALAVVLFRNVRVKQRVNELLNQQKELMENQLTGEILLQKQQLLESKVKAQQEELRATQAQLRLQQERERIARDLHDHVGAQLSVIAANASTPQATTDTSSLIGTYAREAIQSLRDTVWAIDQPAVTLAEFRSKLQQYINRQQLSAGACRVELIVDAVYELHVTSAQALNLFRQIQEALHNAFKYAKASQIIVRCEVSNDQFMVSICDNGVGFDPAQLANDQAHYGLRNLQRRATELQGECRIETAPGQGTNVIITIPLSDQ